MRHFWLGIASATLLVIGLWQMEIVFVQFSWGLTGFVFPFGFVTEWWVARDIFYTMIVVSWILALFTDTKRKKARPGGRGTPNERSE